MGWRLARATWPGWPPRAPQGEPFGHRTDQRTFIPDTAPTRALLHERKTGWVRPRDRPVGRWSRTRRGQAASGVLPARGFGVPSLTVACVKSAESLGGRQSQVCVDELVVGKGVDHEDATSRRRVMLLGRGRVPDVSAHPGSSLLGAPPNRAWPSPGGPDARSPLVLPRCTLPTASCLRCVPESERPSGSSAD